MNPQRTRYSSKARIKNKKDLEMKHKNRSSSISLKDFSPKIWNGRGKRCVRESGRCFSGWEWSFVRALPWGREVGVSIYRWGSKTSRFWLFCPKTGWTGPKTGWTGFQKAAYSFFGWHSRLAEKKWTVQKPVEPVLEPVEPVSTRQKPVECPAEPVFWKRVNSAKTGWTCFKTGWTCFSKKQFWPR